MAWWEIHAGKPEKEKKKLLNGVKFRLSFLPKFWVIMLLPHEEHQYICGNLVFQLTILKDGRSLYIYCILEHESSRNVVRAVEIY